MKTQDKKTTTPVMSPKAFSELLQKVMTTPTPSEHDGVPRPPVRRDIARVISGSGDGGAREKISAIIQELLDTTPDKLRWVSDIHLFHNNIIHHCGRPFRDRDEMNSFIIGEWQKNVAHDDTVLILGDVTMAGVQPTNAILRSLPGRKLLVAGNHDVKKTGQLLDLDVEIVSDCAVVDFDGKTLLMSHCVVPEDVLPEGCVSVHGHIHSYETHPRAVNVSIEWTKYRPMTTSEIFAGLTCSHSMKRCVRMIG